MHTFKDCTPAEGIERLFSLLSRLTLLADTRRDLPLDALFRVADAINFGDTLLATRAYHELCAELLQANARRVSGDIWVDYLLYIVLERENALSLMAAEGLMDEAISMAARMDLSVLGELATLGSAHIRRMIKDRHMELQLKPRHAKDNISLMSTAVWSGGTMRPLPADDAKQGAVVSSSPVISAPPGEAQWLPFEYGEMELRGSFVSDEALEEVYIRMLKTPDWRSCFEDIWNFFAAYGSGAFIRHRAFTYSRGTLIPIEQNERQIFPIGFYDQQRGELVDSAIRFMRGETAKPILLYGGSGTGKTTLALDLLYELPEVRLVRLPMAEFASAPALLARLRQQPLRFVLMLDDIDINDQAVRDVLALDFPGNIYIVATSRGRDENDACFDALRFPYPSQSEFVEMVAELLAAESIEADRLYIRKAVIDYQIDAREKLSIPAALAIARRYKEAGLNYK